MLERFLRHTLYGFYAVLNRFILSSPRFFSKLLRSLLRFYSFLCCFVLLPLHSLYQILIHLVPPPDSPC